ncbi:MAG TPA: glycosyltransferase [Phycisphaerae bacterium]|nr:glycosyltransferase [Phycisphaerae bacterium]
MNDISGQPDPVSSADKASQSSIISPPKIRAVWIVSPKTLEMLSRALNPLAVGLTDELIELIAVCPQDTDVRDLPTPPVELISHAPIRRFLWAKRSIESLTAEIKSRKVQLVHALDAGSLRIARTVARDLDLPYIVSCWGMGDARRVGNLNDAAAVLAGGKAIRQGLLAHKVALVENIHLVRPGVHQVHHTKSLDENQHSIAIIAGGDMSRFESFAAVLESFAELRRSKHECIFFLIGSGRMEKRLRARVEQLHLRHDVTFVDCVGGWQLPGILKSADICISPVGDQAIDMLALLGMAGGIPVFAPVSSSCDFLIDGKTALLFKRGDASELTVKLRALLDDKRAGRELAQSALNYLGEHHSPAGMVSAVTRIYRQAVL